MRAMRALFYLSTLTLCSATLERLACAQATFVSDGAAATSAARDQARKLFEAGVELEKKADYVGALEKYTEAGLSAVTPGLRFHKGYCLEMIGKLAHAFDEYDAADQLAREQNKQDVHSAILLRLEPLRSRVPQIIFHVAVPAQGTEVRFDAVDLEKNLLDGRAIRVDPGEHTFTASAPGYATLSRKIEAFESVTTPLDITLERVAPAVASPTSIPISFESSKTDALIPPPGARVHPSSAVRFTPIATTLGAVALAGAGVVFFLIADSAQGDARQGCASKPNCDDYASRIQTFDALALSSFVGAAGLGVLSLALWTSRKEPRTTNASAAPSRVVATASSLRLEGTF